MAKITYDVTGVEASGGGGLEPQPGVYPAKIVQANKRDKKRDGSDANDIELALNLGGDYIWVYTYIGLGSESDWKLREFIDALGLKDKGNFDTSQLVGKMVRVRIKPDSYEDEYRARAGRLMVAQDDDDIDETRSAEPETDDGPDLDTAGSGSGDYPDGYEPIREDDDNKYDEWPAEDVTAEFGDRGLEISGRKTQKAMITALRDDDTPEAASDDSEGDVSGYPEGYEPERETDDNSYDDWSDDDIKGEFEDRGLETAGGRGSAKAKMIAALRADDEDPADGSGGGSGGDDTSTAGAEGDDYDNLDLEELVKLAVEERSITLPRGKKDRDSIIALLREDDEKEPF